MGLRDAITKGVGAAFKALGDLVVQPMSASNPGGMKIKHYTTVEPVRNPNTGAYTRASTDYPCTGVYTQIERYEGRANVLVGDRFLVIQRSEVPVVDVGDIVYHGTTTYEILNDEPDPSEASSILHIRKKKVTVP